MSLFSHLELVKENRSTINQHHNLVDIMFLIISAITSGCKGWQDIEIYGNKKLTWLRRFRPFVHGIPTRHSIARIFRGLDSDSLLLALYSWVNQQREKSGMPVIAFDGKTIRGASKRATDKLHLVSAYDCDSGLTLLHNCVDSKSNEIPAVRELLQMLDITGAMVTLDAMHCQKETLSQLISRKADYVVQAKGNQKNLYCAIANAFQQKIDAGEIDMDMQVASDKGHGREELRTVYRLDATLLDKEIRQDWSGIKSIIAVERVRTKGQKTSIDTHYYLSSSTDNSLISKQFETTLANRKSTTLDPGCGV
ncbi:ISAs1 family transposase ISPsesp1 [Pseudoalteromonas sp. CIP111854]|uniref:ISAs1 family transposase ISPsesp1 n=2 Tax=Pseudoalteromonas TaxID=53246 RepID=A0A9W4QRM3_9GAMM|nr:ISAs1 family transposase ISPsesp1 [Pseudoalteromonas sp. CIP111854]